MSVLQHIRGYVQQPLVRPWALAGPVLVIILCLPFLHPLIQPDPRTWDDQQQLIASTVQALVERHTLAIEGTVFADNPAAVAHGGQLYSPYPPMLPALIAPLYWVLLKQGVYYSDDLVLVQYLLTLFCATVPLAICAGMLYRLARMFELRRPLRLALSIGAVLGGGLLSYGVIINYHVPAAALLLIAISCISHLAVARYPYRNLAYAAFAGFFATLAATLDPPAAVFAALLCVVLLAMRWSPAMRVGAVLLYVSAGIPVLILNASITYSAGPTPVPFTAPDALARLDAPTISTAVLPPTVNLMEEEDAEPSFVTTAWHTVAVWIGRVLEGLVGEHGILTHYPVMILGVIGVTLVLHRNWTGATKSLAAVSLAASVVSIVLFAVGEMDVSLSYGAPWFLCLSPALLLWAGAWLKRHHRPQSWAMVGIAFTYSVVVGLVGMSDPIPREGYMKYSFAQATAHLLEPKRLPAGPDVEGEEQQGLQSE